MITSHRKDYSMIEKIIEELKSLSRNQLIQKWQELFDLTPSPTVRREFLIKHLAWEIQAQSQGRYTPQAVRKLEALAQDLEQNKDIKVENIKLKSNVLTIKAGTKLIREYQGVNHEVLVLEKGFQYKNKPYKSLSAIANKITNTRWNGKVFFGLKKGA
jgi:hypothetical protein